MKKYKLIIFDLDGTLMDTSVGIINCYNEIAKIYEKKILSKEDFGKIGGSPPECFQKKYGMNEKQAREATQKYRTVYAEKGIYEAVVYEGIQEVLKNLRENGYKIVVATLKLENLAKRILKEFKIDKYFDEIYGVDENDKTTKLDLLKKAMNNFGVKLEETVLIGDSEYDMIGAKQANIDFVAVLYGLGFSKQEEIEEEQYECVSTVQELEKIFRKKD